MKKLIPFILLLITHFVYSQEYTRTSSDGEVFYDYDIYKFREVDDSSVSLHDLRPDTLLHRDSIVIPKTIKYKDNILVVKYIDHFALLFTPKVILPKTIEKIGATNYNYRYLPSYRVITSEMVNQKKWDLYIPEKVSVIEADELTFLTLNNVFVDSKNKYFCSIDGVLYNKDSTILVYCPPDKKNFVIPSTVNILGKNSFESYKGSKKITIPKNVSVIREAAFRNAYLKEVVLNDNIDSIYDWAFQCSSIKEIIFPDTLKYFGTGALASCSELKRVELHKNVTILHSYTFSNCQKIKKIALPNNTKTIEREAFSNCKKLKKIALSDSLNILEEEAFWGCANIKKIIIPDSVIFIGNNAFNNCEKLKKVVLPEHVGVTDKNWFKKIPMNEPSRHTDQSYHAAAVFLSLSPTKDMRKYIDLYMYNDFFYVPSECVNKYRDIYTSIIHYGFDKYGYRNKVFPLP